MQVDATHVETNQTKNEEVNFVQLARLTLEECIKLAKEGRCFCCCNTGHISRNCDKNTNPQVGNQTQKPWPPRNNQGQNQGWRPTTMPKTPLRTHAPQSQNPPLSLRNRNKPWKIWSHRSKICQSMNPTNYWKA